MRINAGCGGPQRELGDEFVMMNSPREPGRSEWIPCKDRLPERMRKTYWVCTNAGGQYACRWTNNLFGLGESDNWGWSIFDIPQYSKVDAWMPLPEPYEEHSMEEFMYGQDPGDPEDGSL